MGRKRLYGTPAERQRAYRTRRAADHPQVPLPRKTTRRPSRPRRLAAIEDAVQEVLGEYEEWRENLPESLAGTDQAARLDATIESLTAVVDILGDIDPPLGFGRD